MVSSESKTRRRYGKSEWTKRESSRRGGTWDLDPVDFFLRDFFVGFFVFRDWSLRTGPSPPLERNSTFPLVTAVLTTPKGARPPGSRRLGVLGALVLILPYETF